MFRCSTVIRELVLRLAEVMFILKHSVKLCPYRLCGGVATCHRAECVLCAVQNGTEWRVCCVLCRMRMYTVTRHSKTCCHTTT
jgi:hypothetical protein